MSEEKYELKYKGGKEDVNDIYDNNKIKIKKSNFALICIFLLILFAAAIVATYFLKSCNINEADAINKCKSYLCKTPSLNEGILLEFLFSHLVFQFPYASKCDRKRFRVFMHIIYNL